jgi:predicted SAM-dependent methyltransferase
MDGILHDLARCEKVEPLPAPAPFGGEHLRELGITGIEFAAFSTRHAAGLASDVVPLRAAEGSTTPGRIFRVDGAGYFAQVDICQPLPFQDASVEWVYAEHLIEHVTLTEGIGWLREVRRILAPGGLLRLTTPDLRRYVEDYLHGGGLFGKHRRRLAAAGVGPPMPDRDAFMFNQMFYHWGHRWIYDAAELRHALAAAGFDPDSVRDCAFRRGGRPDVADLDQVLRNDETIYVEVTR